MPGILSLLHNTLHQVRFDMISLALFTSLRCSKPVNPWPRRQTCVENWFVAVETERRPDDPAMLVANATKQNPFWDCRPNTPRSVQSFKTHLPMRL